MDYEIVVSTETKYAGLLQIRGLPNRKYELWHRDKKIFECHSFDADVPWKMTENYNKLLNKLQGN